MEKSWSSSFFVEASLLLMFSSVSLKRSETVSTPFTGDSSAKGDAPFGDTLITVGDFSVGPIAGDAVEGEPLATGLGHVIFFAGVVSDETFVGCVVLIVF